MTTFAAGVGRDAVGVHGSFLMGTTDVAFVRFAAPDKQKEGESGDPGPRHFISRL
jgi:hypothetical protein